MELDNMKCTRREAPASSTEDVASRNTARIAELELKIQRAKASRGPRRKMRNEPGQISQPRPGCWQVGGADNSTEPTCLVGHSSRAVQGASRLDRKIFSNETLKRKSWSYPARGINQFTAAESAADTSRDDCFPETNKRKNVAAIQNEQQEQRRSELMGLLKEIQKISNNKKPKLQESTLDGKVTEKLRMRKSFSKSSVNSRPNQLDKVARDATLRQFRISALRHKLQQAKAYRIQSKEIRGSDLILGQTQLESAKAKISSLNEELKIIQEDISRSEEYAKDIENQLTKSNQYDQQYKHKRQEMTKKLKAVQSTTHKASKRLQMLTGLTSSHSITVLAAMQNRLGNAGSKDSFSNRAEVAMEVISQSSTLMMNMGKALDNGMMSLSSRDHQGEKSLKGENQANSHSWRSKAAILPEAAAVAILEDLCEFQSCIQHSASAPPSTMLLIPPERLPKQKGLHNTRKRRQADLLHEHLHCREAKISKLEQYQNRLEALLANVRVDLSCARDRMHCLSQEKAANMHKISSRANRLVERLSLEEGNVTKLVSENDKIICNIDNLRNEIDYLRRKGAGSDLVRNAHRQKFFRSKQHYGYGCKYMAPVASAHSETLF